MKDYKKELEELEAKESAKAAVLYTLLFIGAMVAWKIFFRQ